MNVHMDESLSSCHCSHWPSFRKLSRALVTSWGTNHSNFVVKAIDTRGLPHQCQTQMIGFTMFICCGCSYGCFLTTLPLLMLVKLLNFISRILNSGYLLLRSKPQWRFVVEAIGTFRWLPLPHQCTAYRGVVLNFYTQLMCIWMSRYHVATAYIDQAYGSYLGFWLPH
jgi:hypothetical protein